MRLRYYQVKEWACRVFTVCLCLLGLTMAVLLTATLGVLLSEEIDKAERARQERAAQKMEIAVRSQRLYHAFVIAADSASKVEAANAYNGFIDSLRAEIDD